MDMFQLLLQRNFGVGTANTRACYQILHSELYSKTTSKIVLILHGQGAIEGGAAIDWLLQEVPIGLFSKLEVYTFGSAANHFNNPCLSLPSAGGSISSTWHGTDPRVLGHVEHYANSKDFISRLGVLRSTEKVTGSPPNTEATFAGQIFEYDIEGHLFNAHYMDTIFPLDPIGRAMNESSFMESTVQICDAGRREEALRSLDGAGVGERFNRETPIKTASSISSKRPLVQSGPLKANQLSRLWLYRNAASPPPNPVSPTATI